MCVVTVMSCCRCNVQGAMVLDVQQLPKPVQRVVSEHVSGVCVCASCIKDIGNAQPFGNNRFEKECASATYACTRQKRQHRRGQLRVVPYAKAREYLGIPVYAPQNCICQPCHQFAQNLMSRGKVKNDASQRSTESGFHASTNEEPGLAKLFFENLLTAPSEDRLQVLRLLLNMEFATDRIVNELFSGNQSIRCQLYRLQQLSTRFRHANALSHSLEVEIINYWLEEGSEPDESRKLIRVVLADGTVVKDCRRWSRDTFTVVWQNFSSETGANVSYSKFCQLRPKCIKRIPSSTRCRCRWHLQCYFKLLAHQSLRQHPKIVTVPVLKTLQQLVDAVTCSETYLCCFGLCAACRDLNALFPGYKKAAEQLSVRFSQFVYEMDGRIKLLVPKPKTLTLYAFIPDFKATTRGFLKHHMAMRASKLARRELCSKLPHDHVIIFMDYSAKFVHEPLEQVQEDNYQKKKTSILVFMVCFNPADCIESEGHKERRSKTSLFDLVYDTYYFISPDLKQNFNAVATAFNFLLNLLSASVIHVFSDGGNTFKVNQMLAYLARTCRPIYWDCAPTGHGKGKIDSEGFQIKRFAKEVVRSARKYNLDHEIKDAKTLFEVAKEKMKIANTTYTIRKRHFYYLPNIPLCQENFSGIKLNGIRQDYYSFFSRPVAFANQALEYTVGYRPLSCNCTACIASNHDQCDTPGAGVFRILERTGNTDSDSDLTEYSSDSESSTDEDSTSNETGSSEAEQEKAKKRKAGGKKAGPKPAKKPSKRKPEGSMERSSSCSSSENEMEQKKAKQRKIGGKPSMKTSQRKRQN